MTRHRMHHRSSAIERMVLPRLKAGTSVLKSSPTVCLTGITISKIQEHSAYLYNQDSKAFFFIYVFFFSHILTQSNFQRVLY